MIISKLKRTYTKKELELLQVGIDVTTFKKIDTPTLRELFKKFFKIFGFEGECVFGLMKKLLQQQDQDLSKWLIKYVFDNYDKNNNGTIDMKELEVFFKELACYGILYNKVFFLESAQQAAVKLGSKITFEQFYQVLSTPLEQIPFSATDRPASISSYSSKIQQEFIPILQLFGLTPSGSFFNDVLRIKNNEQSFVTLIYNLLCLWFSQYDKNGDGFISRMEARSLARDFISLENDKVEAGDVERTMRMLFKTLDEDNNGKIDRREFVVGFLNDWFSNNDL